MKEDNYRIKAENLFNEIEDAINNPKKYVFCVVVGIYIAFDLILKYLSKSNMDVDEKINFRKNVSDIRESLDKKLMGQLRVDKSKLKDERIIGLADKIKECGLHFFGRPTEIFSSIGSNKAAIEEIEAELKRLEEYNPS